VNSDSRDIKIEGIAVAANDDYFLRQSRGVRDTKFIHHIAVSDWPYLLTILEDPRHGGDVGKDQAVLRDVLDDFGDDRIAFPCEIDAVRLQCRVVVLRADDRPGEHISPKGIELRIKASPRRQCRFSRALGTEQGSALGTSS
jgi:hypothetical protein